MDLSKTDRAEDTESVEISTDLLLSMDVTDDSMSPSTSSFAVSEPPETSSTDDEDWLDWVFPRSGTEVVKDWEGSDDAEVVASVVVDGDAVVVKRLLDVAGTVFCTITDDD